MAARAWACVAAVLLAHSGAASASPLVAWTLQHPPVNLGSGLGGVGFPCGNDSCILVAGDPVRQSYGLWAVVERGGGRCAPTVVVWQSVDNFLELFLMEPITETT